MSTAAIFVNSPLMTPSLVTAGVVAPIAAIAVELLLTNLGYLLVESMLFLFFESLPPEFDSASMPGKGVILSRC